MKINKLFLLTLLIFGFAIFFSGCSAGDTHGTQRDSSQISVNEAFRFENDPASSSPSKFRLKISGQVTCKSKWHGVESAYLIDDVNYEYELQGTLIQGYLDTHRLKRVYVQYPEKHCLGEVFMDRECVNGSQVEVFGSVFDSSLQEALNKETEELLVNVCHCTRKFIQMKSP